MTPQLNSIDEILDFLFERRKSYDIEYKLDRVVLLFQKLHIEKLSTPIIHIAGTNGKGSTSAMLESVYRNAGYKTGLFTSPHLCSHRERIKVDNQNIESQSFIDIFHEVYQVAEALERIEKNNRISFFEYETAIALRFFQQQNVDVIILETGLGGRLDATNAITFSDCSVITTIAFDHEDILGNTLEAIAKEKSGIITRNSTVIVGAGINGQPLEIIKSVAQSQNAKLTQVPKVMKFFDEDVPEYQNYNASTAYYTALALNKVLPLDEKNIKKSITSFFWPARWQVFANFFGKKLIIDGAHNEEGAQNLVLSIQKWKNPLTIIFASNTVSRAKKMLKILAPVAKKIILTSSSHENSLSKSEISSCFPERGIQDIPYISLEKLVNYLQDSKEDVLVTGSLYLAGDILKTFNLY